MQPKRKIFIAKSAAILSVVPVLIYAYASGPDPRKTGAPGDSTCNQVGCHVGTALNGGGGNVVIKAGSGTTYTPGQKQRIQVVITDSAARVYGFQASARPDSNSTNGQAGTFDTIDGSTQVLCEDGTNRDKSNSRGTCKTGQLEFIEHTAPQSSNTYSFDWTAPSTDVGPVTIYAAANAANGNGQPTGDHIYTAHLNLTVATTGPTGPTISSGGVAEALTYQVGVTASAWIAIFGQNLSATTRDWTGASEFTQNKLPMSLNGVSVTINNKPAAVYYVSPGLVSVLAPADIGTGTMNVVVTNSVGQSPPATVTASTALPAFYAPFADSNGKQYITAEVIGSGNSLTFVGKTGLDPRVTRAAQPGELIVLYGTGFGSTTPAQPADSVFAGASPVDTKPVVSIAGIPATVVFAGIVSPGLYLLQVTVPDTVPDGDQPIQVQVGSISGSPNVLLSVKKQ